MIDIKVPTFPESITEGTLIAWHKQPGDTVNQDDIVAEIETDKVVFEVPAPASGVMGDILCAEDSTVASEQIIAQIDETAQATPKQEAVSNNEAPTQTTEQTPVTATEATPLGQANPAARNLIEQHNLDRSQISGSGTSGRIHKQDVKAHINNAQNTPTPATETTAPLSARYEERAKMSRMRTRIAERLLFAKQNTAMLTTFNEVNMQPLMSLRSKHKEAFESTHGVKLGFMSLFIKAATETLLRFPDVNAAIDGDEIVYHSYADIGVAVSTERGLVVPILRNTENMSLAQMEQTIADFAERGRKGSLTIEEITGGTFSITNGGVFGSLLSTPILNPPQSAILGMHNIVKRAVVENDTIVIRPMMYLALSYDHRIIDGKTSVTFLRTLKELIEDPMRLLLEV